MNLIGKLVTITDKESWLCGEWGRVIAFDGDYYYITIADGDEFFAFYRQDFRVRREPKID